MKYRYSGGGLLLVFAGIVASAVGMAQEHVAPAHRHDRQVQDIADTAQPARFATDAPLREGMARIRAAVAASAADDRQRELSTELAATLASEIEQNVNFLFANCRLEPAADAALHGVLAQLLQGAAALRRDPTADDGMPAVLAALDSYPRLFLDTQWQAVP